MVHNRGVVFGPQIGGFGGVVIFWTGIGAGIKGWSSRIFFGGLCVVALKGAWCVFFWGGDSILPRGFSRVSYGRNSIGGVMTFFKKLLSAFALACCAGGAAHAMDANIVFAPSEVAANQVSRLTLNLTTLVRWWAVTRRI